VVYSVREQEEEFCSNTKKARLAYYLLLYTGSSSVVDPFVDILVIVLRSWQARALLQALRAGFLFPFPFPELGFCPTVIFLSSAGLGLIHSQSPYAVAAPLRRILRLKVP